ncbi:prenyltransferase/squalene oxidase repeat-containing protein [Salinithrix halophila]|uniref:Prenyltransferase/squalene oxidase repeat-containing protein n=2 Tax=Salinithrix halophila TaxID=1485204 RepID=A0ABV8JJ59_9BACL
MDRVNREIGRLTDFLIQEQGPDGRWTFCFESRPMTDAYGILFFRLLGMGEEEIQGMARRLEGLRDSDGLWRVYPDEKEGNLSATLESTLGLMAAGRLESGSPEIEQIREWVRFRGGPAQSSSLTQVMLTLVRLLDWSRLPRVPVEILLLPRWLPISFWDLVGYARVHAAPVLLASHRRFSTRIPGLPLDLSGWGKTGRIAEIRQEGELTARVNDLIQPYRLGRRLAGAALARGERFILDRIEPDGTLYSYFSTTFFMLFGLMALGYPKRHPIFRRAAEGLKSFLFPMGEGLHMQETTSTVWDTSLIAGALTDGGMKADHPTLRRAASYLAVHQHHRFGDWSLKNPRVWSGGWGFSDINTINPDCDDTASALRALAPFATSHPRWKQGVYWLLSMQNRDGGWPAFEKNTDKKWPLKLLQQDTAPAWTDPSSNDLTGRVLYFLGRVARFDLSCPAVGKAVGFLTQSQEKDGSWFGRWGVTYLYGTWAALTGMAAVGIGSAYPPVARGMKWLLDVQNEDGGWGESCRSDQERRYIPLGMSTPSQTAWALDALIACSDKPTPAIQAGIRRLLELTEEKGIAVQYPTGAGLAGQFYIHYHSYRYIWPLTTLANYRRKFGGKL